MPFTETKSDFMNEERSLKGYSLKNHFIDCFFRKGNGLRNLLCLGRGLGLGGVRAVLTLPTQVCLYIFSDSFKSSL